MVVTWKIHQIRQCIRGLVEHGVQVGDWKPGDTLWALSWMMIPLLAGDALWKAMYRSSAMEQYAELVANEIFKAVRREHMKRRRDGKRWPLIDRQGCHKW